MKSIFLILIAGLVSFNVSANTSNANENSVLLEDGYAESFQRLEDMAQAMEDELEKDQRAFLIAMTENPIDYDLLNSKIAAFNNLVSQTSPVVDNIELKVDSVLTGKLHKAATFDNKFPELPYKLPFAATSLFIDVDLAPNDSLPVPVHGFRLQLDLNQSKWSPRGLLNILGGENVSWTDSYEVVAALKIDTMKALQLALETDGLQAACADSSDLLADLDDAIKESPEVEEIIKNACGIVMTASSAKDFDTLISQVAAPIKKLNKDLDRAIDQAWKKEVGGAWARVLNFSSRALYDYALKVQTCESLADKVVQGFGLACRKSFSVTAQGGAFAGDADGTLSIYADEISIDFNGNVSSGIRASTVGDKIDLATQGYIFAKVLETATDEEIEKAATGFAELLGDLQKELDDATHESLNSENMLH